MRKQIPDVTDLARYHTKISHIKTKYFTTSNYNKFTGEILDANIKEKGLVDKSNIPGIVDNSNLDKNIAS